MNETRRLFLLSALTGLAGTASLAFAPALVGAALPVRSASEVLRAVVSARPALSHHAASPTIAAPLCLSAKGATTLARHGKWRT